MIAQRACLPCSHFNFFNRTNGQPGLAERHAINPRINVRQHKVAFLISYRAHYLAIFLTQNHGHAARRTSLDADFSFDRAVILVLRQRKKTSEKYQS